MSVTMDSEAENMAIDTPDSPTKEVTRKRKSKIDPADEIEIDLNAPEPLSKKAARKAKKLKKDGNTSESEADGKKSLAEGGGISVASDGETTGDDKQESGAAAKPATPKPRSEYGVWIGNLAFTTTKEELRAWIVSNSSLPESSITRLHMPGPQRQPVAGPKKPNANRGFAYVDVPTENAMNDIIALSETLLSGRALLIKSSKNYEGRPEHKDETAKSGKPASNTVFVGNLGFESTTEDLSGLYGQCGEIVRLHMATFEDTGRSKGFAWIEFADIEDAKAAQRGWAMVEDDNDDEEGDARPPPRKKRMKKVFVNRLHGRQLRTEFAEDKTTRYNKRFGKDAKPRQNKEWDAADGSQEEPNGEPRPERPAERKREGAAPARPKAALKAYNGKDGVVQKMTGGIIKSEGKKVVFD